jgi:NAD-dependent dihydropyrimidine dehydrogenase PreA subunit
VLLVLPFWRAAAVPLAGLVWGLSCLLFLGFPHLQRSRAPAGPNVGFVFFDYGPRGTSLLIWLGCVLAFTGAAAATGELSWTSWLRWAGIALVVLAILGVDLMGSTPTYKSGLHDDRRLRIALDEQRCKGAGFCEDVCPVDVFTVDRAARRAILTRPQACVQCGACIVQCPFDALDFKDPEGGRVGPEAIRKFKLNLIGRRRVQTPMGGADDARPD